MSDPPRAVIDTNVLVAAAIKPTGTCARLLRAAHERRWLPVISPKLLEELEEVLRRERFRPTLTEEAVGEFVAALPRCAMSRRIHRRRRGPRPIPTTTTSWRSRAAGVEVLISGDRHLTGLAGSDVTVEEPQDFLARISEAARRP